LYGFEQPKISENFDFSIVTLRRGFLFILFVLLFLKLHKTYQQEVKNIFIQEK